MVKTKEEVSQEELDGLYRRAGIRLVLMIAIVLGVALSISGRRDWWFAWVYILLSLVNTVFYMGVMYKNHPELLHERLNATKHAQGWDKLLVGGFSLFGILGVWIVASLDVRFGWSIPLGVVGQSVFVFLSMLGLILANWAVGTNRFFSSMVRLQDDRGHKVVDNGPYAIVRHPGYAGSLLYYLTLPVGLGAYWALVPALIAILLFAIRTWKEDSFLQKELEGYKDYTQRVRFRLIPGVW